MKILHVTPYFYEAWAYGGIPRLSYYLASAQAGQGHEVHCVTTDVKDRDTRRPPGDYEAGGVKTRVHPNLSNLAAYDYQIFTPKGLAREASLIRDYDVVHIHGHRNFLNTRIAAMARRAGVPAVLQPNGTLVNIERRRMLKSVYDLALGRAQIENTAAFIAVAEIEKRQMTALGVAESKIRVFPNGVVMDADAAGASFRREFGVERDYLLYLGKITPRKGIEHAIMSLCLIDDKDLLLVVAGNDMGFKSELEGWARRLHLEDRVVFTGLLTGPLRAAAYRDALYTVYAGRDEIFGLVPWESILCGAPVIVADDSGCGEWIGKAGAGHLVPYGEPDAIAKVVNYMNPSRDIEMVERGRGFCETVLDWDVIAAGMVEFYKELS